MNKKQIALAVVLADFAALTVYAVVHHGYVGVIMQHLTNSAGLQVLVDLVLALSIVMVWMWHDARRHDINPVPYVLLTLGLGSIGPLVYLIRRFGRAAAPVPSMAPTAAHMARA